MARLYWRVKVDGKWTWKPVQIHEMTESYVSVYVLEEDE